MQIIFSFALSLNFFIWLVHHRLFLAFY